MLVCKGERVVYLHDVNAASIFVMHSNRKRERISSVGVVSNFNPGWNKKAPRENA